MVVGAAPLGTEPATGRRRAAALGRRLGVAVTSGGLVAAGLATVGRRRHSRLGEDGSRRRTVFKTYRVLVFSGAFA